ncbi:MAG: endonuclease III [Christensenellales bacterium]
MEQKTKEILEILSEEFPSPKSELVFGSPFELLVAVILSAQCTDKRVNQVTPELFAVADTPQKMAALPDEKLEKLIFSCGFYKNKARFLKEMSRDLIERFGGQVPDNLEQLRSLSGVGRKTANVVYAVAFGGQAIAVDTHVFRVANRLGLAHAKNVLDTEKQLCEAIDRELWADSHHYLLLHGRYVCKSQRPDCSVCRLKALCEFYASGGNKSKEKN